MHGFDITAIYVLILDRKEETNTRLLIRRQHLSKKKPEHTQCVCVQGASSEYGAIMNICWLST